MRNLTTKLLLMTVAMLVFATPGFSQYVLVSNLNEKTTSESLLAVFEEFGVVLSADVSFDPTTGRSRRIGMVKMTEVIEAQLANRHLNATDLDGNKIATRLANANEVSAFYSTGRTIGGGFGSGGWPKPQTSKPNAVVEKVLDPTAAEDLITEAANWLSDLTDDGDIITAITEKWDAIEDITGKTRTQLLNQLLTDAKDVITDKTARDAFVKRWNINASLAKPKN